MEPIQDLEKYSRAKIEEPELIVPPAMMNVNTDPTTGELYYFKIFEDDIRKAQHLCEAIANGVKPDRKVYRIRKKELLKVVGDDYEGMQQIHRVSKATIGLLVDEETGYLTHSYIDLVGTAEQVQKAEELILDKVLRTYGPVYPVILMPPSLFQWGLKVPLHKLKLLTGEKKNNALSIEVVSGAWMQISTRPPPGAPKSVRLLKIYGPRTHVVKAATLVHSIIFEPGESAKADKELEDLFNKLSFDEITEGMKPRTGGLIQHLESFTKESGSGSGSGSGSVSGSGSGQTEEQKQKQHGEDVEGSQDKSKDENQEQKHDEGAEGSQDKSKDENQEQKHDEDAEGSQAESKDKNQEQKHGEDVEGSQAESKDENPEQKHGEDVEGSQAGSKDENQEQKHEEDVEGSKDESKDENQEQKHEEDVKEAVSDEASQQNV